MRYDRDIRARITFYEALARGAIPRTPYYTPFTHPYRTPFIAP